MVSSRDSQNSFPLPPPEIEGNFPLEKALYQRRSIRSYRPEPLQLNQVSQLLWAAQGITDSVEHFRTAPSAGALFPLQIYLIAGDVEQLDSGVYLYQPFHHQIVLQKSGDVREAIFHAGLYQSCLRKGAILLAICARYEITTRKYGRRGIQYVHMEVGHVAQNIYLQATALGLGTVLVGAFYETKIQQILNLPTNEIPLGIMPVGAVG